MKLYLDTSALVSIFLEEDRTEAVSNLLGESLAPVIVSDLAAGEFGAAVSMAFRIERLTAADADATLQDFDLWFAAGTAPATMASVDIRLASTYVRRFDLALLLPDALHLAVCLRLGGTLVTGDKRQAAAAAALGIAVIEV